MSFLETLIKDLCRLPGIGPKSASRIAYFLIKAKPDYLSRLANEIASIQDQIHPCHICGSFSEGDTCPVCLDASRDKTLLCIVENPQDVITISSSGAYNGLFHVLGGAINPLGGIGPENLSFNSMIDRIENGFFEEIIIATNPTEEGDTTALFIRHLLSNKTTLTISRLASGLPIGGDLEYADRLTLARSLRGRVKF